MINLFVQLFLLLVAMACSPSVQEKPIKAFYLGHSLSDGVSEMVWGLANSDDEAMFDYGYQRINGTPLRHQWNQYLLRENEYYLDDIDREMMKVFDSAVVDRATHLYHFFDDHDGLLSGTYTHLVMTESVPRYYGEGWGSIEDTYRYVDSFYNYARQFNPDVKPYLYEVWHCINSGTPTGCPDDKDTSPFRKRLEDDLLMWESVVDRFNSNNPQQPLQLIPVGQGLGRLSDAIDRGEVPGVKSVNEWFTDDIHVNDTLRYFSACIHYAMLFDRSPIGLTGELRHLDGQPFVGLTTGVASKLQKIAWETVQAYRKSKGE